MLKAGLIFLLLCFIAVALAVQNPSPATLYANDNKVLQLNLAYERLEIAFTRFFLDTFTVTDFVAAGYEPYAYNYIQLILDTEEAHAAFLTAELQLRGASLPPNCSNYNFSYGGPLSTVTDFLVLEQALQAHAVYVLDGSINVINDKAIIEAAATIATVEARMTASLDLILGETPFYNKSQFLDNTINASTLLQQISGFYSECPSVAVNLTANLPQFEIVLPQTNSSTGSLANPGLVELEQNDIAVLQYALTLEHLEANFYSIFENQFRRIDYFNAGIAPGVRRYVNIIRAHEKAHVAAIELVLNALGYVPVPRCTYNFSSVVNVTTFLALARVLENTGVSAYDGAANAIFDPTLKQIAASIATIEARHAAFLNEVNNILPFPDYFDTALAPADVVAMVTKSLIVSCPYPFNGTLTLPVVIVVPDVNSTSSSSSSTGGSTGSKTTSGSVVSKTTSGSVVSKTTSGSVVSKTTSGSSASKSTTGSSAAKKRMLKKKF